MYFMSSKSEKSRVNIGLGHHNDYTHAARAANLVPTEKSNWRKERRKTEVYLN
ncbi:hypothetical protein AXF42_Ash004944 [Apostasia shenzhenica]|uniref:Uncharacterized protein n=1 Tax=Apostasia shenzhenica TaxID=1088818 RepID=A0A2I0B813_9ASPA|nr:hypothetical protein AXF42_Ash004944 [Apostasia shenzhenica]